MPKLNSFFSISKRLRKNLTIFCRKLREVTLTLQAGGTTMCVRVTQLEKVP